MTDPNALAATHAAAFDDTRAWGADEFAALLQGRGVFLVGDPICFALGRVIADEAELLTLATLPDRQRQGLARTCLAAWLAEARRLGAARAFLEVASDNDAARTLYVAAGFVETGRRRGYYLRHDGSRADALVMQCLLDPTAGPSG